MHAHTNITSRDDASNTASLRHLTENQMITSPTNQTNYNSKKWEMTNILEQHESEEIRSVSTLYNNRTDTKNLERKLQLAVDEERDELELRFRAALTPQDDDAIDGDHELRGPFPPTTSSKANGSASRYN